MKLNLSVIWFVLFIAPAAAHQAVLRDLTTLKWQNRIVLVNAPLDIHSIQLMFEQNDNAVKERDIIWFIFTDSDVISNYQGNIHSDLYVKAWGDKRGRNQRIVLVGKDGGVKHVSDSLELDDLFKLIDGMPIRRQEMADKQSRQ